MAVRGALEGLCVWVGGGDSFAHPRNQGGFVLGAEDAEATVLANLGALVALGALAPLSLGVRFLWYASLSGEMGEDAASNQSPTHGTDP